MQADFKFLNTNGEIVDTVSVELLDTPASLAWQYAVHLNNKNRKISSRSTIGGYSNIINQAHVDSTFEKICACIDQLADTEFPYTGSLPETALDIDQQFLNQLHRYFTDSCLEIWNYKFSDFALQITLNEIFQQLNILIHAIENYFPTPQKQQWQGCGKEIHLHSNGDSTSYDIAPFRGCHSYERADLVLDSHILGKTLIESFMCNDNPAHWDTSGHVRTSGGCVFLLTDHRQQIYNSNEFIEWLSSHQTSKQKQFADLPLGNLIAGHRDRLDTLLTDNMFNKYTCEIALL